MSNFRPTDRRTGFLMPPSVEEWMPQWHVARFVVEVVDGLDLRTMSGAYPGSGSASYDPAVLLSLLVYGYATGVFSAASLIGRRMIRLPSASSPRMTTPTMTRSRRFDDVSSRRSRHCSSRY